MAIDLKDINSVRKHFTGMLFEQYIDMEMAKRAIARAMLMLAYERSGLNGR